MNKENINLVILFIMIVIVCVLIKRYNKVEHFTNNNNSNTVIPPESTYNLQQYIETNPPTGSKIIKREISHTLPDVIDKDIVMRDGSQIRFGSMRNEAGSDSDNWHIQGISDASEPYLKMVLGDNKNKNSSFQIYGGACTTDSNCSADGRKLFDFDSQPNLEMYDRDGNKLLHANKNGDLECKRNLNVNGKATINKLDVNQGVNVKANSKFDAQLDVGGNMRLTGGLHSSGDNSLFDGKLKIKKDIEGNQDAKIDGLVHSSVVNANDANVRRRLYFSKAGNNNNNWKENPIYTSGNFSSAHDSDVVYIEKKVENTSPRNHVSEGKLTTLVIKISDDRADGLEIIGGVGGNNKLMRLDGDGNLYIKGSLHVTGGVHSNYGVSQGVRNTPDFSYGLGSYV